MAKIVFTGKPRITLVLLSHLGITEKDKDKIEIAKKVLKKYGSLSLTVVDTEDDQKEYCFTMSEFPPQPAWKEGEGVLHGVDIVGMAAKEFFEAVKEK